MTELEQEKLKLSTVATPLIPDPRKIKDSGERTEFSTGAVRDTDDKKPRPELLPADTLLALAAHFSAGCSKYGDRNWEKGIPLSRFYGSAQRHMLKYLRGDTDEPHLTAAIWNLVCLYQTDLWIRQGKLPEDLNDLPANDHKVIAEYSDVLADPRFPEGK